MDNSRLLQDIGTSAEDKSIVGSLEVRLAELQELYEALKGIISDSRYKKFVKKVVLKDYENGREEMLRLSGEALYRKQGYLQAMDDYFMKTEKKMRLVFAEIGGLTRRINEIKGIYGDSSEDAS